jgi:hypothetical protein
VRLIQVRWAATMVMNIADVHLFLITTDLSILNVENSLQHQLVHIVHCGCPLFEFAKCVNKSHSTNLRTQFCKACQQITLHQLADTIATICGKPTLATTVRRMLRTRCDTRATHVRPPCGTHWCHFQFFDHWALRNTLSFDCCKKTLSETKSQPCQFSVDFVPCTLVVFVGR